MSFPAIIPASDLDAANAALHSQGFGPTNFSVSVFDASGVATHAAFHAWDDAAFRQAVEALPYDVTIRDADEEPREQVTQLAAGLSIVWPPEQDWLDNLPMTGDIVTFDGTEYRSLIDNNVWSPTAYPQGWELVDAGGGEWVDSGATTNGPSGANTMGVSDDSPFQAGQTIRVDQDDALVTTVTGIHSANLLLIDPHVTVGSGQMIEIEQ
ncbi:MAG: hypothetical protein GVY36_18845 [Verrucomicrobia bacterium]|jgi:hypothetical protein|nr:hypothetical protein [Verrucomicrobiota bacterium]